VDCTISKSYLLRSRSTQNLQEHSLRSILKASLCFCHLFSGAYRNLQKNNNKGYEIKDNL
jgi:hypothetical protein